ncbi:response regulator transcription factor [Tautonia marina]|uniref:response regulator transcription factor n=1 Tax=Tautonia marina TaxID=2653855 RepID=UPI0012608A66|nr:helix-turn-helix transcriptional regulator [Tautonia marina]
MSKSSRLRAGDALAIHHLIGECRELGDDVTTWHQHLIEQLIKRLGGTVGLSGEQIDIHSGRMRFLGQHDWGWESDSSRAYFFDVFSQFVDTPGLSTLTTYSRKMIEHDGICLSRSTLFSEREWKATQDYEAFLRPIALDNPLWCMRSIPGVKGDESIGVTLLKTRGDREFDGRDRAFVQELVTVLAPLAGGPLARFSEPSPRDLAPRARQVLRCLLEGDSDKQIARRLHMSIYTVNQYTKAIYQHFRVHGRNELMARWIRRGWGSSFSWAD